MKTPLPESLDEADLDWIVESLEEQGCNLLLGSEIEVVGTDGESYNLAQELGRHLAKAINLELDDRATLPSVAQEYYERNGKETLSKAVANFMRDFPVSDDADSVFKTLAKLPFRVILTSRHDHTFDGYLEKAGKEPFVRSWNIFRGKTDRLPDDEEITIERPLVFYICGEIDKPGSLIVSEDHVIDFVRNLALGNPPVPPYLQMKMQENRSLLVGFGVPKWYTRVILDQLGKGKGKDKMSFAFGEFDVFDRLGREGPRTTDVESVRFHMRRFNIHTVIGNTQENIQAVLDAWHESSPPEEAERQLDSSSPYVFISYCGEDAEHAEKLHEALEARGIQHFWDRKDLRSGHSWPARLAQEMERVTAFVLLVSDNLSERAANGSVVFDEARMARRLWNQKNVEQFLLPIFVDDRKEAFNLVNDPDRTYFNLTHERVTNAEEREAFVQLIVDAHAARAGGSTP